MRKGNTANVLLDSQGEILAIGTGSDSCAEHECGSMPMQRLFCRPGTPIVSPVTGKQVALSELLIELRGNQQFFDGYFNGTLNFEFPQLLERKRISNNLDKIVFGMGVCREGEPIGILACSTSLAYAQETLNYFGSQSVFNNKTQKWDWTEAHVAGAWDEKTFALAVKGEQLIDKLARFAAKLQSGQGLFAGTFLRTEEAANLKGVVVMDFAGLKPEHRVEIDKAQDEFEATLVLNSHEASTSVNQANQANRGLGHSFVWNVWHPDEEHIRESDFLARCKASGHTPKVVCAINPDAGLRDSLSYGGPYLVEDLIAIAKQEQLGAKPLKYAQAVSA